MRNKMKRFGKRVLLPAMAATIMTMQVYLRKFMPPEETEAVLQP